MTRKCGFLDCNNPAEKETNRCQQRCKERKENNICSACRQPETKEGKVLNFHPSLIKQKYLYRAAIIVRDKLPAQFQTELSQLLPQLKLSASEQGLITKAEKLIADFLAKKGGKQDHIDWLLFCSVCNPEIVRQMDDLTDKNPQNNETVQGIKEKEEKFMNFIKKVQQAMSEAEWKKWGEEVEEEFYKQVATNPDPNNDGSNRQPNQNDNSAQITQLQQEINTLRQEIQDLKNSGNTDNSDALNDLENKLNQKSVELEDLKNKNNPPQKNQPDKNNNSDLSLKIGLGVAAVIIVALVAWLVIEKKKKKKNINSL